MVCRGFKKVPLRDTKGVLNKTNNFKWVKGSVTVLPTGTKINRELDYDKVIIKPNGTFVKFCHEGGSKDKFAPFAIIKGKDYESLFPKDVVLLKSRTAEEAAQLRAEARANALAKQLNKKREAFIRRFNKKYTRTIIKSHDGNNLTKLIHDKETGELIHWFRKDKKSGNTSIGDIVYYPFGKEVTVSTPNNGNTIIKAVSEFLGSKNYEKMIMDKANNIISKAANNTSFNLLI